MNKANIFVFLLAVSPLLSYFIGRYSRALGLAAAAALMAGSAFALGAEGLASGPAMALLLWTLAALAHSAMVNADHSVGGLHGTVSAASTGTVSAPLRLRGRGAAARGREGAGGPA